MQRTLRSSKFHRRALLALVLAAAMVAPVGVLTTTAQDTPTATSTDIQTRVQFLHAAPDSSKMEISLNGDTKVEEFEYGDVSDWIDIDPGSVQLSINADRRGINYLIFNVVYPVPAGNDYYVVITDDLVLGGALDISPITDGSARVSVLQASVDLPEVNVVAKGSDVSFAAQLTYPRTSDNVSIPAGTYDIQVNVASSGETAAEVPGIVLDGNKVYALVIIGEPGDDDHPVTIVALQADTAAGRLESAGTETPTS